MGLLKDGMGVKDEKCWYYGSSLKNLIYKGGGGAWKTIILEAKYLKTGAWIVCRFKEGLSKKKGVDVFEVGLRPQCTLWIGGAFLLTRISKVNNIVTQ